jgi:glutamate decarboxylase
LCDSNLNTGIPTVTWRIRDGEDPGYTLTKRESGGFSHL